MGRGGGVSGLIGENVWSYVSKVMCRLYIS